MKGKMIKDDQLWIEELCTIIEAGGESVDQGKHSDKLRRSTRVMYPVKRLTYHSFMTKYFAYISEVIQEEESSSFEDAVKHDKWKNAMKDELEALLENGAWTLLPKKQNMKPIGCKWVYKVKCNLDGSIARCKARLVAKGYAQKYGIDYEETFSLVARMTTVRTIIALAALKKWNLYQLDVKNAFLNGDLQETIYLEQPQGYVHPKYPNHVCKLKKALYGFKQAPRAWYEKLVRCLICAGFQESKADPSLYIKHDGRKILIICIYDVDDLIVTGDDFDGIEKVKYMLNLKFKISDLGELKYFLGIEVIKTNDGVYLSQRKHMLDILKKFGMLASKPLLIPINVNIRVRPDSGKKIDNVQMYRNLVGSLLYATIRRPDISYTVGVFSQFMQEPTNVHLNACKRVLSYLKGTINHGLFYAYSADLKLEGYSNADWAGSPHDRRSTSGFVFMIGGSTISWSSKKQSTVALSSTEAEYKALTHATCEAVWLNKLLADLDVPQIQVLLLFKHLFS